MKVGDGHTCECINSAYRSCVVIFVRFVYAQCSAVEFIDFFRIPVGDSMFDLRENIPIDPKFNNDLYFCNCDAKEAQIRCGEDLKNTAIV